MTVHSSALGTWAFHECRPAGLASWVESIWEVEGAVASPRSRIFPNGRVDLLFNLGPPQVVDQGVGMSLFDSTCVSGVQTGPLFVEAAEGTHLFGVRLRAEGATALLGAPMSSLTGRLALLPDVAGRSALALVDRLRLARDFGTRARIVCRWIEECRRAPLAHVAWIASQIDDTRGVTSISGLQRLAGLTPKRLAADFRAHVGVTPKFLARLVRFREAIALLQRGTSIADVALSAGYYDQSHLGLDFRELAGLTPRELVASIYPDGTTAVA